MLNKILTLLVLIVISFEVFAQSQEFNYKVFFNVDESKLDEQDHLVLNQLLSDLKNQPYYEITLTAHTDFNASYLYNEALSKRRALSVEDYLVSKGLKKEFFNIKWQGEMMPASSNLTLEGKAQNRRVEIKVIKKTLNNTQDLIQEIKPQYLQSFNLNKQGNTIISSENGMTITVPENAFTTKDGKTVPQDQVVLKLEEFHQPMDFIFNKLSTISDGKMLESGGMFKITAEFNKQELLLRNDKKLDVEMPSKNIKPNMNVFTGKENSNGVMEWQLRKETFGLKNNKIKPIECPVVMDENILKSLYYPQDLKPIELTYKYTYSGIASKPQMPKEPRYSSYPSESQMFTWLERMTLSKSEREIRYKRECDKIDSKNLKRKDRYEQKMNAYNIAIQRYPQDSINSLNELASFNLWLNSEINALTNNTSIVEQKAYNRAVDKMIKLNRNKKLNCKNVPQFFAYHARFNESELQTVKRNKLLMYALIETRNNLETVNKRFKNGEIDYSNPNLLRHIARKYRFLDAPEINRLVGYGLNNPYMAQIKRNAELQKIKTNGINNQTLASDAGTIYKASFSNMGYINCDRFTGQQLVNIEIEADKDMQISLYVKSVNGMLNAYYNANTQKYIAQVPKNVAVQVLVMGVKNGVPVFESQNISFDKTQVVATSPKISTTERILEQLKKV
jgi:hypothetical protein